MGRASAEYSFAASVQDAEALWYETRRWPEWIDGLRRVIDLEGDWPRAGATVIWQSTPAGRGRVIERVTSYEPGEGQVLEVQDDSITGCQRVSFAELEGGVLVSLALEYKLKARSLITPVVDLLFIRRAIAASLRSTLERFGVELAGAGAVR
jgi:hypothetical protein